jgi:hypothetical protein
MTNRNPRSKLAVIVGMAALLLAGCNSAQQDSAKESPSNADQTTEVTEAQRVAEAALGKAAVVLAHGDLARNGLEQILIANRQTATPGGTAGTLNPAAVMITRAVIVEKKDERWTEILRCDEHLKNPLGYLGNSPRARVSGWRLEFDPDAKQGLEMKFTPADPETDRQPAGDGELTAKSVLVRWNTKVKRYQSLDQSEGLYLSEIPTLETPQTTLK